MCSVKSTRFRVKTSVFKEGKGFMGNGLTNSLLLTASLTGLVTTAASAGFTSSGANFTVVSTADSGTLVNTATQISSYVWANTGSWTSANASVTWANDTQGWNPITGVGFTNANVVIRNNTASAQNFLVTIAMLGSDVGPHVASGSIGGQYVNGSGSLGSLTSTGPLWSGLIDTTTVNSQLNNALFFAQPYSVMSLGNFNFSNIQTGGIGGSASIKFSLRLSAGGEASFTSAFSFQSVPAPAAFALFGMLPLARSRRRR